MNQQEMKEENKKRIFSEILSCPGISRTQLASRCCYSKTTVSILVDELIREGYVEDGGTTDRCKHTQGRRPTSLFPNTEKYSLLVVNVDRRFVQIAKADFSSQLQCIQEIDIREIEDQQVKIFDCVDEYISNKCRSTYVLAVCWILPAMIDREHELLISDVLGEKTTDNFFQRAEQSFPQMKHFYFNDTACLAYAEKGCGDPACEDDFVYINMNEGVGAAFVINGNLLGGPVGLRTQFGSISLGREKDGRGNRRLEDEIGETVVAKRLREREQKHGQLQMALPEQLSYESIGNLARKENAAAKDILNELAADMSYALGNLITMLYVKRIVIGGAGRSLGSEFLNYVRRDIVDTGFSQFVKNTQIVYSGLGQHAALSGAVKYFLDQCFEFVV